MERSAVGTSLLGHLAGEPTRVLTEVNSELPKAEEASKPGNREREHAELATNEQRQTP